MLRCIASILTFTGCLGLGVWYRERLRFHIRSLDELCTILETLSGEISHSKKNLAECFYQLSENAKQPYCAWFREVLEAITIQKSENAVQVMKGVLQRALGTTELTGEEQNIFLSFLPGHGYFDEKMQVAAIERSRKKLQKNKEALEEDFSQKSKMMICLGIGGGAFVTLLLL